MFGLGWLCYSTFQFFVSRNWSIKNILVFIGSFLLIAYTKVYILLCFIPALTGWVLFNITKRMRNRKVATLINFASVLLVSLGFMAVYNQYSELLGEFSFNKFEKTSEITRNYIAYVSNVEKGSAYDLGELTPGLAGMLSKFPQAVTVTLFRPYLWEANKIIVFLNALESLAIFLITIKLLISIGIKKIIRSLKSDYTIQFTLIFSVIFAFFVGISTYNFGTLSRYKIPCIPFYLLTLVLMYYQHAKPGKRLSKPLML